MKTPAIKASMAEAKKIQIAVSGASGRMGRAVLDLIKGDSRFVLGPLFDKKHPLKNWKPGQMDLIIDFSRPEALKKTAECCVQFKKPLVSGTTGLTAKELASLKTISKKIPLFWAPNMSLGVSFLNGRLERLPPQIKKWDISILDIHHRRKKDSPSGTALFLEKTLSSQGVKTRPLSIRAGGVRGSHKILMMGEDEMITMEHLAFDRKIFAAGALEAALFILKKKRGFYTMKDLVS